MDLSRNIILEIDLNTGHISTTANNYFYNTDRNIAYFYIKLYRTNIVGEKQYISDTDSSQYNVSITTIKPKTISPVKLLAERVTNSDIDDDIVYKITIPNELMRQQGFVYCEGHVIYNKQELTTDCFSFKVNPDKLTEYNLTLITDPDLPILQDLINQVKYNVRGIRDGQISDSTVWSSKYTNTKLDQKADKTEVFTMANMGQDIKEAMTGGSVAVVGKNTILTSNIVNNQVTAEKTSFLERGKNMIVKDFSGGFINWQTGDIVTDSGYFYSDYIPVTPGTKISLNYHSALAFYDNSFAYVGGINGSGTNSKNYTLVEGEIGGQNLHGTYTVPQNAAYIRISRASKNKDIQLELGEISTDYEEPYYYIPKLLASPNKNIFIKNGNECTIITQKAKYIFKRVTDTSINVDAWRLYTGYLVADNGTPYKMWNNSDAEGAIQIVGEDDFVCGYHGDEIYDALNIMVDGVAINMSPSNNTKVEFDTLIIESTSKVYHCNTSANANTQAFSRTKLLKFDSNKVTISNRFKCLEDLQLNRASLALFQCYKSQDGAPIINKFSNNNDLVIYDVPTTDDADMPEASSNMTEAILYTDFGVINCKINKGYDNPKYMGYISNFNDQNRLKVYFDYIKGNTQVSAGDILQTEFEFSIK